MRLYKAAAILFTIFVWNVCPSSAAGTLPHDLFSSDILGDIATVLKCEEQLDTLADGIYIGKLTHDGKPLTVVKTDGVVCHIGYAVFPAEVRQTLPSPVYNVLERSALVDGLRIKRKRTVAQEFEEEGVTFGKGKLRSLPDLYKRPELAFSLENRNGRVYHATWKDNDDVVCEIDIPYSYEFINGTDMDENERRLVDALEKLVKHSFDSDTLTVVDVDKDRLIPYFDYYILPGKSYYFDGFNSNRYYEMTDSVSFRPIYTPEYPRESLANVCTSAEIPNNLTVELKVVRYGFNASKVEVPLTSLVEYFCRKGCQPFFGIVESNDKATVCEILFRNTDEGYCHIAKLTAPADAIAAKEGKYTARLNSFIPISKIESLFADK